MSLYMNCARSAAPMTAVTAAANNQAPMRLSSAVSTALPDAWLRPKPTTNACAGSAITSRVMSTTSTVPEDVELPNRAHSNGQTIAEKMPASAAVTGVGEMFTEGPIVNARSATIIASQAPKSFPLLHHEHARCPLARDADELSDRNRSYIGPPVCARSRGNGVSNSGVIVCLISSPYIHLFNDGTRREGGVARSVMWRSCSTASKSA